MRQFIGIDVLKTLTPTRIRNVVHAKGSAVVSRLFKRHIVHGLPYVLTIEPTNRCNLRCPQCVAGLGQLRRGRGIMEWSTYKTIIDQMASTSFYLLLYNQGEPFLHPDFVKMIRYAKMHRFYVTTSTNGHFLIDDGVVDVLVASELDSIIISLDGVDSTHYEQYRKGGDFNRVIDGIRLLQRARKNHPAIFLQYLVMRHNENRIPEIKRLAKDLKVDKLLLKTLQIEHPDDAEVLLPQNSRWRRYRTNTSDLQLKHSTTVPCSRLWTGMTVLWDGTVVPCCFDKHGQYPFGNVTQQPIHEIWRSLPYEKFRIHNLRARCDIDICTNCTQGQAVYL
ncbi:SPASM domain-containing protein [candidate division KSB1 bacterium]|nr:SPASM domain-containing protein [candidate division KSB1 bacterium]